MDAATAEVFDAFVRARHAALLRYGTALTGDPHRAADLVQDASLKVTYAGFPLYVFFKDEDSGDQYGEGIQGAWFVVSDKGALVKHAAKAPTATGSNAPTTTAPATGGGGGGYGSGYGYGG